MTGNNTFTRMAFVAMAILAFLLPAAKTPAKKATTTKTKTTMNFSLTPDFAFPRDVFKNAEAELDRALRKGDDERALMAAMQIFVSRQLISSDSIDADLRAFAETGRRLSPFYRSLADLYQADLLARRYDEDSWQIRRRAVPGDAADMEIGFWGEAQFADSIVSLVDEAFRIMPWQDGEKPWKNLYFCLDEPKKEYGEMLTVKDFILLKGVDALRSFELPYNSESLLPLSVVGQTVSADKEVTPAERAAAFRKRLAETYLDGLNASSSELQWGEGADLVRNLDDRDARLRLGAMMERAQESPGQVPVLTALLDLPQASVEAKLSPANPETETDQEASAEESERRLRSLISEARDLISRYPAALYKGNLQRAVASATTPNMRARYRAQYLPSVAGQKLTVEVSNLNSAYLLVYKDLRKNTQAPMNLKLLKSNGKPVAAMPVRAEGEVPFGKEVTLLLPELAPGAYVLVPSRSETLSGAIPGLREDLQSFAVSEFSALTAQDAGDVREYAVSGRNGAPLDEVSVSFRRENWKGRENFGSLTTGAEGFVTVPDAWKSANKVIMSKDLDEADFSLWINQNGKQDPARRYRLTLLPARAIVRPGDELQFAGIAYSSLGRDMRLEKELEYTVDLVGANGETVDSLKVTTDAMGRFEGKFVVPRDGMLGNWVLKGGREGNASKRFDGMCMVQVEEYSNPTFRLILDRPEMVSDSVIRLSGRAETFSGMGVAGARVDLDIKTRVPRWWFFAVPSAAFHCRTATGADGRFSIELSTAGLAGTQYERAALTLSASAVSPGGETQRDEVAFSIGEGYALVPDIADVIEASDKELALAVRAYDLQDRPQSVDARYSLTRLPDGKVVKEGEFKTPALTLMTDGLASSEYRLTVWIPDSPESKREKSFTLWRRSDEVPPAELALWVPETVLTAAPAATDMELIVGSSYPDQKILLTLADTEKVIERRWISPEGKNMKLPFPAPAGDSRLFVTLTTVRDLKSYSTQVTLRPASADRRMEIEKVSFRDKLTAGDKEEWKLRFRFNDDAQVGKVAAMGVMTDLALDRLVPFNWSFSPRDGIGFENPSVLRLSRVQEGYLYANFDTSNRDWRQFYFNLPGWVYGHAAYKYGKIESLCCDMAAPMSEDEVFFSVEAASAPVPSPAGSVMVRGTKSMKMAAATNGVISESAEEEAVADAGSGSDNGGTGASDAVSYREAEFPLAFFKPMLTADKEGIVTLSYEVPNFNTTWKFQLLGYDERLYSARQTYEALSAKEVMVAGAMPRFLRTGDKARLTATLFNNSLSELKLGGGLEILDPTTGRVLTSRKYKDTKVGAGESRLVDIEFEVPADMTSVLVRSYASGGGHSDGEQELVPVLPSSSPVVESTPFYIAPAENSFELTLPKMEAGSKVTLLYCDNPAWYALTALPSLVSDVNRSSSVALLRAYYGNAIGLGLLKTDSTLRDGLSEMLRAGHDGMLTSNLELNSSLKTVLLKSTPWLLDARSETARMQSLGDLLDSQEGEKKLDALFAEMLEYRNPDGGISWCADAPSSSWASGQTLLYLSMLNRFGFLKQSDGMKEFTSGLDRYNMNGLVERWKEIKKHGKMNASEEERALGSMLLNYLYIRSAFKTTPDFLAPQSSDFRSMTDKALRGIEADWRDLGIYEKATAATLLWRSGKQETARTILESLSQFASESKEKGMWFANLQSDPWSPWNPLITTAQALEAWAEIEPESPAVDRLRQWMLIQRQAQDWSLESYGAELVAAVLSSGTQWTSPSDGPLSITLNGKQVADRKSLPAYGEAVIDLDWKKASGARLRVEREGASPAWGGVMEQYVAPIEEIKGVGIDDLTVEKSLFVLRQKDGREVAVALAEAGELKVGDKVRVLLSVDCARDLEYVVLTDERGATLEPADQLSSRDVVDGVWLYREVRDTQTNFFVPYLRKGKFQLSYECRLSLAGDYTAGIATLQSQYAPTLTAHSAGLALTVRP